MMLEKQALKAFAALSQETRLKIVRILVVAGSEGLSAGEISKVLECTTPSKISFHLNHLEHAGLIISRREGRNIIYCAIFPALSDLVAFLMHDCCQGHCQYCDDAITLFAKCTGQPT